MLIEILLAAAGAMGYAMLFGMRGKNIWLIAVNSAFAWYLYLLIKGRTENMILAMFLVTVLVGLVAGILAMLLKCPMTVFATPILMPFIPGSTLYYVMYDAVNKREQLSSDVRWLLLQVGAIAFGILAAEIVLTLIKVLYSRLPKDSRKDGADMI